MKHTVQNTKNDRFCNGAVLRFNYHSPACKEQAQYIVRSYHISMWLVDNTEVLSLMRRRTAPSQMYPRARKMMSPRTTLKRLCGLQLARVRGVEAWWFCLLSSNISFFHLGWFIGEEMSSSARQ